MTMSGIDTDERYTPDAVLDVVRALAPIWFDPCTIKTNPTGAQHFFTRKDDGLTRPWPEAGLTWINPPYSRGALAQWAERVAREGFADYGRECVFLSPCDLGTRWADILLRSAQALAFWRGRITFVRPDGTYETGAKTASAFWYFGERTARFARVFGDAANVVPLPTPPRLFDAKESPA